MFLEPGFAENKSGWIEVICGCMFSGKTEELLRRINRARIARQSFKVFKPVIENRYHHENVVTHNENFIEAIPVSSPSEIIALSENVSVIAIDEAQFFDNSIVDVCNSLANNGSRVIVAGLDMNSQGKPFGPMPYLLAVAEFVTKLHAICAVSGELASFSFRKSLSDEEFLLGATDIYEARSRKYFYING